MSVDDRIVETHHGDSLIEIAGSTVDDCGHIASGWYERNGNALDHMVMDQRFLQEIIGAEGEIVLQHPDEGCRDMQI